MMSESGDSPRSSSSWHEVQGGEASSDQASQQQLVQKLMRLAGSLYEQRGYAGTVSVSWMCGVYEERCTLNFERVDSELAPWIDEEVQDLLERDSSRAGSLLRQLLKRLEGRAKAWGGEVPDDLSDLSTSKDPLLGAQGSIGFSLFGMVGWQISVSIAVYASRLRRWRQRVDRCWPLLVDVPRWRPVFDALQVDGLLSGVQLRNAMASHDDLRFLAEVPRTDLRDAWHLADVSRDGSLDLDEFVLFLHLVSWARAAKNNNNKTGLPLYLPSNLIPPSARKPKTPPDNSPPSSESSSSVRSEPRQGTTKQPALTLPPPLIARASSAPPDEHSNDADPPTPDDDFVFDFAPSRPPDAAAAATGASM